MFNESTRAFLKDLGAFLQLPAILCIPTFIVIVVFKEWYALTPFAILAAISFGIGQLLYRTFYKNEETTPGSSYALVSLIWFLLPLLGVIPFYGVEVLIPETNPQIAIFTDFHNAFFESMSGFTGTGLSVLDDPGKIPHSLQWWRSISEWIGGLGIIFLAVAILDTAHMNKNLYQSEAMGWMRKDKDMKSVIMKIWWIYISYTILSVLLFYISGMPFWEALNHGFTGISTGGFSVTKDSFVSYSENIKWVAVIVMLIGSFSFKIHVLAFERNFKKLFQQTQLRYFIATFILILGLLFVVAGTTDTVDVFFQAASALGTCGFNSVDLTTWTSLLLFPLSIAMFMGGNSSSTTGGLKTRRLAWLFKTMKENIRQSVTPDDEKYEFKIKYNHKEFKGEEAFTNVRLAAILLFVWIVTLTTGTFLLTYLLPGSRHSFHEIFFDINSALNNVGLSSGVTSHQLPTQAKWVLSIVMWIGRLEIMGVIVMFAFFIRSKKD